jgi:hypothetical protein
MLRGIRCGLAVLCGVLVAGTSLAALAADTGTIKGKVTFKGGREAVPPESQRKPIKTEGADPNCTKRIGTNEAHVDKDADGARTSAIASSKRRANRSCWTRTAASTSRTSWGS